MAISDVFLWSFAFILSFIGIFISWIGAVNSTKANDKLTSFLSSTWTEDEAKKLFFEHTNTTLIASNKLINILNIARSKKSKTIHYAHYIELSKKTRLPFVSQKINDILVSSKYNGILSVYIENKKKLDFEFTKIFDFSKLQSMEEMTDNHIYVLSEYHNAVSNFMSLIITQYINLAQSKEGINE